MATEVLHGDIAQAQRERTLKRFRDGRFSVLVATDVAARGLDITDVDLVVHYELPHDTESFVHRCGRTGRANKQGSAIAMYTPREQYRVKLIVRETGVKFRQINPPTGAEVMTASAEQASLEMRLVDDELLPYFTPTAEKILAQVEADADARSPVEVVAAALAAISGHTEPPPPRSMLTGDVGLTTLVARADLLLPRDLLRAMSDVSRAAADGVGRIRVLAGNDGLCFDITHEQVKPLLAAVAEGALDGIDIEVATTLPEMVEERERGGNGGRGGGRGRGRGRGRGGGRGFRGGGGGRFERRSDGGFERAAAAEAAMTAAAVAAAGRVFRQAPELRRPRRRRRVRRRRPPLVRGERRWRRRRRLAVRRILGLTHPREPMHATFFFVTRAHRAPPRKERFTTRAFA